MSRYAELATQAGDQYLQVLAKAQETYLGAIAQFAKQMPQMPQLPQMAQLPDGPDVPAAVREAAEVSLAFAQKALDQQKAYVEKLLAATEVNA